MSGTGFPQTKFLLPTGEISQSWRFFLQNIYQATGGGAPTITAAGVSFSPTGSITVATVQTALAQLDTLKVPVLRTINTKPLSADITLTAADVGAGTGNGTVTTVSVVNANGFDATVANAGTTPAITLKTTVTGLLKGDGTAVSAAASGTDYVVPNQPDLTNPLVLGAIYVEQGAPTSKGAAATLTIAELLTGIIQYTGAAAALTLPTGASIDVGVRTGSGITADRAFDFCVINTGSGTATITTNTGLTLVGTMTVATGVSAQFRARKTAASTYTVYRVA